jgi:hypothetical protein
MELYPMKRTLKKVVGLELPKERSTPAGNISDYIILIYGREKIGKTTLCSHFPRALFLMFEPGGKALSVFQTPVHTWVDFKNYISLLKEDTRFDNIVIDTADICYKLCLEYVMKTKLAGNHPSEEKYGKGWDALKTEFQSVINSLCKLGKGVIFLSHATEKEIKLRTGGTYDVIAPTMQNTARNVIEPISDIFAYYYYGDNGERFLKVVGDDETLGGGRVQEAGFFPGVTVIPMGSSSEESYKNLVNAFQGKFTPKQVSKSLPARKGKLVKRRK